MPRPARALLASLLAAGITAAAAGPAAAGIIRHDVPDADYIAFGAPFPQVGTWGNGTGGTFLGTGTNAARTTGDWVLTAQHVGIRVGQSFSVGGAAFTAAEVVNRTDYRGINNLIRGGDLTLVRLSGDVTAATGLAGAGYNARTDELGRVGVATGAGATGNGLTGPTGGAGTFRAGQNVLDADGSQFDDGAGGTWDDRLLMADFDAPAGTAGVGDTNLLGPLGSDPDPTGLEFMLGGLDSGAGLFVDFGDGNGPVLAGVNSFVFDADGTPPYGFYGDGFGVSRVSGYADWILDTTGIAAANAAAVPEPAAVALIGLAAALGLTRRRRTAA